MPVTRIATADVDDTTTNITASRPASSLHQIIIENGATAQQVTITIDSEAIIAQLAAGEQKRYDFNPTIDFNQFQVDADPTTPAPANVTFHYTR